MADPKKILGGLGKMGKRLTMTDEEKVAARLADLTSRSSDQALPLILPRARMTPEFIDQQADRVARQMLGEHVTSGKPKDTTNLAGRSMKESQRVKGLDYVLKPTGNVAKEKPYSPRKGDVKVAFPGDQTVADKVLESVNDVPINSVQEGGAYYGLGQKHLDDPEFWKSNKEPANLVQGKVDRVAELYEPERVIGTHLAMGPTSNNFAMHFADANLRAIDWSKAQPKKINVFDNIISGGYKDPKTGEMVTFPNWPGLADPDAALAAMKEDSNLRKWFNNRMKTPSLTEPLGLPNGLDIQYAITEPRIRDMEINMTGLMTGKLQPGALVEAAGNPHNTYSHRILGEAEGSQEVLTPFVMDFPDAAQHIASTKRPSDFTGTIQKVFPHQLVDDQYIDEYNQYRERIKKLTGQKDGGEVDGDQELKAMISDHLDSQSHDQELRSMVEGYMAGGEVGMADGGKMVKGAAKGFKRLFSQEQEASQVIGKAAESAGMNAPVTANKPLTNLQDFHTSLGDAVRNRAAEMQNMVESMPFKYDKGQRVFTEGSAAKNKPPYTILYRLPFGNQPMYDRTGNFPKVVKDPETGKTMRTPYEPGYRVRYEDGDEWSQFDIPESSIKGDVEMAGGGKVVKGAVKGFKRLFAEPTTESKVIQPPSIIIPSKVSNVKEAARQSKGEYGARRVERAADEIPNLEKLYKEQALREAFLGDNAKAVMTMNPADFQKYAKMLQERSSSSIGPKAAELARQGEIDKITVPTDEYIQHLQRVQGGFNDVPYLRINKDEQGLPLMPFISGHEGRHRSRAMAESGEPSSLVRLSPNSELREPFPRRSQEEYIEALKRELEMTDNMVLPEGFERPPLKLPDVYADGGVAMAPGGLMKGLGKIGKRLMADPMESAMTSTRRGADQMGGLNIAKEPGGNWLTGSAGSVEKALQPLKRDEFIDVPQLQDPKTAALNKWVDGNLTNYVKKQMATKDDPVRKLAEEGIVHMPPRDVVYNMHGAQKKRAELGQPQLGQSDAAKAWENNTDALIHVAPAGQYTKPLTASEARQGSRSLVDENPWLEKVAPETPINAISADAGGNLGFDHIMDVLREDVTSGRMRPEQLNKVNMEQAVRRTHEYDQELAAKINAANAAKREGLPVYKDYPEGYRWIELNKPGSFASESDAMGHSVRGYEPPKGHPDWVEGSGDRGSPDYGHGGWEAIKSGKAKVYSLVDSKGVPHTTIEVAENPQAYPVSDEAFAMLPSETRAKYSQYVREWRQRNPDVEELTDENTSQALREAGVKPKPPIISQIKGKSNAAPNEEYLPFVQDFVRGGEWSSVGDLRNAGLIRADAIKGAGHDMIGYDQKYLTKQEYDDLLLKNLQLPTRGMAEGGGAFKTLRFDNSGIASPEENLTYESKPSRFSKVASEMYDETKQSLANDYERLKNSGRARAQLAKIAALQLAGGAPDLASMVTPLVNSDALLSAFPAARMAITGMTGSPSIGRRESVLSDERIPYSLADLTSDKKGLPYGGSEHLIKRAQEAGLMHGKTYKFYNEDGSFEIDPETGEPVEVRSGRFSLPTEISGAIFGGGALSKMRKVAGKGYQKFAKPRAGSAGALSSATKAESDAMFNQNLRAR